MSTNEQSISRFFKPKKASAAGSKRSRPEEDVVKVAEAPKLSTSNFTHADDENRTLDAATNDPPSPPTQLKKQRHGDIIEIDLEDDENEDTTSSASLHAARDKCTTTPSEKDSSNPSSTNAHHVTQKVKATNPFAKFACASPSSCFVSKKTEWKVHFNQNPKLNPTRGNVTKPRNKPSKSTGKKDETFVKMRDISKEEQARITRKWHSMANPQAPLEVRRYQVLLAARLHARCQEPTVRKAMATLQNAMPEGVTVETMAKTDPKVLASHITNLQFYNVKAQHAVKAAQEIQSRFGGQVPEDESSLSQITGIGKCFADLLAFVNTRKKHEETVQGSNYAGL
jgi:hypothetical protein